MNQDPFDDQLLGLLVLVFFCALAFLAGVLAWNAFIAPPSGFAP